MKALVNHYERIMDHPFWGFTEGVEPMALIGGIVD